MLAHVSPLLVLAASNNQCLTPIHSAAWVVMMHRGFDEVNITTAQLRSVKMESARAPATCLATNGSALFLEMCVDDPSHCLVRAPDCPESLRVRQLWYASMRNQQLLSTFTTDFENSCRCSASAMPKCVATQPNAAPNRPPTPPKSVDAKLPLQVWAGALSGGRLAVALVNAGSSTATVAANWTVLGLPAGTKVSVRDATAGTANGTATDTVSVSVASHDVCMLTLAPLKPRTDADATPR